GHGPRKLAGEILHLAVRLAEGRGHDVETVLDRPVVRVGIARGDPERRVRLLQRLGDRRGARELPDGPVVGVVALPQLLHGGHHHLERLRGDGRHRHVRPSPHHVDGDREPHTPPRRSRGFRATLRPSPSTLRSRTRTKIAAPGNPGTHHAFVTYSSPLVSIWPRLTTFGSPTPRKLSDASARMAEE